MISSPGTSIAPTFPQIQNQPLTGPVPNEQFAGNIAQSPSQAAPTLSMLLESKQKENLSKVPPLARIDSQHMHQTSKDGESSAVIKTESNSMDISNDESPIKDEDQQLLEVFNGLIPDEMEELADSILDDLIDEEQVAAVSSVADSLVEEHDNLDLNSFHGTSSTQLTEEAAVTVKNEPITNINEDACDALELSTKTEEEFDGSNEVNYYIHYMHCYR